MDFHLTEEQRAFQDTAAGFAAEHFAPNAARWDEEKIFPEAELRAAAELGFAAVYVGDDVGGVGGSRLDAVLVMEQLARGCPSTAAYISIHNMASWMIDAFGSDEQRRRFGARDSDRGDSRGPRSALRPNRPVPSRCAGERKVRIYR